MGKNNGGGNPNHDPKTGRFISVGGLKAEEWKDLPKEALPYADRHFKVNNRTDLFEYRNGKGKAFIRYNNRIGRVYELGSTGGGAGTEAFIKALEDINENSKFGASWSTDSYSATSYYKHLGLDGYKDNGILYLDPNGPTHEYQILPADLPKVIKHLKAWKGGR